MPIIRTSSFRDVRVGSVFEVWAELDSGHAMFDVWLTDSNPETEDVHGLNPRVLRTDDNPEASIQIVVAGPAGTAALVHAAILQSGTKGRVVLRVLRDGEETRRRTWKIEAAGGGGVDVGDYLNGLHIVQLYTLG